MKSIQIGSVIASMRKEKGLTQEELAEYVGVSKPAVSKWESGQSYPDITLLPVIASYFGISVDDLLDYQPQMTKEDIRKLYKTLSDSFAKDGFDPAYEKCRDSVRRFYSCWPLLFNMGVLLVNHAPSAGSPEKTQSVVNEAISLFQRVEQNCGNPNLARQAIHLRAFGYLMLGKPGETIDLLEDLVETPISTRSLLATAYLQKGKTERAEGLLQSSIYLELAGILGNLPNLMVVYSHQPEKLEQWVQSTLSAAKAFGFEHVHPALMLTLHINAAFQYLAAGDQQKALEHLKQYAQLACSPGLFPLQLKGGGMFDKVDDLFESFDLGTMMPRSEEEVRQSMKDAVLKQPAFQVLAGNPEFQHIVQKIQLI